MTQRKSGWKVAILGLFLLVFAFSAAMLGTARAPDNVSPAPAGKASGAAKLSSAPSPAAPAAQAGEYAGGDTCFACHDIEEAFQKNPHYKTWADEALDWSERGCETCHGPGQAHVDAGGDVEQIFSFKKASAQKISDTCLDCHLQQEERANFLRNEHGLNTVGCTECHTVHAPQTQDNLLAARTPALCYDCHAEVRVQFNKPFHHKIHEGFMTCVDCHNQHGGFSKLQYRASTGTDFVCYECHADKQGPFVFEHFAVKVEGCTACHEVHGSVNPRMLKRSEVRFLCLDCHSGTLAVFESQGLRPEALGPSTPFFHNITQPSWQNCTTCHINIHGSNLSPLFFE